VVASGASPGAEVAGALRTHAAARLPAYMVPQVAWLDALPLTPNGKVDRRALREPSESVRSTPFVAPRTATELAMAALWRDTLRVDSVGADDRFVDLGGHSLLALRMMGRAQAALGAPLPIAELLRGATLAELSARVDEARATDDEDEEDALVPVARDAYRRATTTGGVGA
jgi:acyl carrier protein